MYKLFLTEEHFGFRKGLSTDKALYKFLDEILSALNDKMHVGFEVLMVVSTKMAVFWVAAPCSLVEVYQHFGGPCCLHYQGDK
jgi:hypothetical protein